MTGYNFASLFKLKKQKVFQNLDVGIKDRQKSPKYSGGRVQPGWRVGLGAKVHKEVLWGGTGVWKGHFGCHKFQDAISIYNSKSRGGKPAICRTFRKNRPLVKIFPTTMPVAHPLRNGDRSIVRGSN